jgi:LPS O-antigen subunit length determinant protein (WzzB/FepE family)
MNPSQNVSNKPQNPNTQPSQMCEDEIDLSQYLQVLIKRKKIFLSTFLFIFVLGLAYILFSPKIYKVFMLIQPPVSGEALSGANDIESAENLKGLIISNAFNEELINRLNIDSNLDNLKFFVNIFAKTNVLEVSVNLESKKKEFGLVLLKGLSDVIFDSYAKRVDADSFVVANQIAQNERAIAGAKEKIKNLEDQIKEITQREQKLNQEIIMVNANTAQMLAKREAAAKDSQGADNLSSFLLTSFLQNNLSFSNQLNNQLSELSIRQTNLTTEIKNLEFKIIDFQMIIDNLSRSKSFISNVRIACQPGVSRDPISPERMKVLALSIFMGLFLGTIAVFVQEFWQKSKAGEIRK